MLNRLSNNMIVSSFIIRQPIHPLDFPSWDPFQLPIIQSPLINLDLRWGDRDPVADLVLPPRGPFGEARDASIDVRIRECGGLGDSAFQLGICAVEDAELTAPQLPDLVADRIQEIAVVGDKDHRDATAGHKAQASGLTRTN